MINLDRVYLLNPHYHLRHDIHRVVLFSRGGTAQECSRNWLGFIHPLQAALLSFFTYDRTLRETLPLLCDYFCKDTQTMGKWVAGFVENPRPVYTDSQQGRIYFPKRVLVEAGSVSGELRFDRLDAGHFVWKKLDLTSRRFYTGPAIVTLMLTNRCVTHCKYCYADTDTVVSAPLPTGRIMELIEEAAAMQVQQMNLIGGELFLHKEWALILKKLVDLDLAPDYLSTKIPLDDKRIAALADTGYRGTIQISLDACDQEILQASIGAYRGYAEEMLESLRRLDESDLDYQVSSVLTTYNCDIHVLGRMLKRLLALKRIRDWRIVPVSNSATKRYDEFACLKPKREQMRELFCKMRLLIAEHASFPVILGDEVLDRQFMNAEGGSCHFSGKECSALTTHLFILPDGKATICEQLYWNPHFIIGDVGKDSLTQVWNSPRALQLYHLTRSDVAPQSPCHDCGLFDSCYGYQNRCWSDVIKAYGADCWDFPDPRCWLAPKMKNRLDYV